MQLPYSEELNIEYLGQLFRNTTECYKFFWFKAIVKKVTKGKLGFIWEYPKVCVNLQTDVR